MSLFPLTTIVNLLALAASLWLGFYIVTRSPRSSYSWIASLTLWSLMGFFLHNTLAINAPQGSGAAWLRRGVIVALPLWFHLSLLLRTAPVGARRGTPIPPAGRWGIALAYSLGFFFVATSAFVPGLLTRAGNGVAIYTSGQGAGPLYPLFVLFLGLVGFLSVLNLWQGRQQARTPLLRDRFTPLLAATVFACLGSMYTGLGVWLRLDLPTLPGDTAMAGGVVLLGYAVARYNALIEGRALERDFLYAAGAVGLLTIFYLLGTMLLYQKGHVSFLTLILVVVIAVSSHSLYDGVRATLDWLFYHGRFRQLRANLRGFAREANHIQALPDRLRSVLSELCRTLHIQKGFLALRQGDAFIVEATQKANLVGQTFPLPILTATDIGEMNNTPDLPDMALLVPLYASGAQMGALVLGPPETGQSYSEEDLDLMDELADQIAATIHSLRQQEENARAINEMVSDFRNRERILQQQVQAMLVERQEGGGLTLEGIGEEDFLRFVEDGLRRLHDYACLGEHALAQLAVVNQRLGSRPHGLVTHIDRGKALNEVLLQALHKLRPEGPLPDGRSIPPREWYPFIILYDSYMRDDSNRDVMSKLFISEGTFNRTRRRALRAVAKALREMEQDARGTAMR
ncbi:MAG: hypothetical protein IT330_15255 [Anaerolineae bacterium]|nr:hypothetical protein [Anaerolineae bacterium]